jgi:hypothetical protein
MMADTLPADHPFFPDFDQSERQKQQRERHGRESKAWHAGYVSKPMDKATLMEELRRVLPAGIVIDASCFV